MRLPETLNEQAVLAKRHGIGGFCFHYYWFAGRRLLETPLEQLLKHPEIDLPFCLNWANEAWTRAWGGSERNVLIEQRHSPDDDIAFATAIEPAFADPRYIRIGGRPLLMLYRPGVLPDASATVARWREHFVRRGLGDPYVVMPQAFGDNDPGVYGLDAAAGFPPHRYGWDLPTVTESLTRFDPRFRGRVMSYTALADAAMAQPAEAYRVFPGVCPNWDNEARRPRRGVGFMGSSPRAYGIWLEHACRQALRAQNPDERIVFINAWNEWAEGAYLEPDRHFGHAYLRETARTVNRVGLPQDQETLRNGAMTAIDRNAVNAPAWSIQDVIRAVRRRGASAVETFADALRPDR